MSQPAASVIVRSAIPADVPMILRFIRELAEYERAPQEAKATEADLLRDLFGEGFGRGPVAEALMAELYGKPVGFALFFSNYSTWRGRSGIYLEDLYVTPESRGVGAGKALLQRIVRIAQSRGCGRVEWSVLDWNEPALNFYRSIGAEAMTEWTVHRLSAPNFGTLGM
jgi:GNAT superfamily N-acetyltransferase